MNVLAPTLAIGLCLLSGCVPFGSAGGPLLSEASASTERYRLVAPMLNQAVDASAELPMPRQWPLSLVTGSSARTSGLSIANLFDGSLQTAWVPAARDGAPQVIFDMAECAGLVGCTIKLGGAATVDVAVGTADGWTTIATQLAPESGQVDWLAVPPTDAAQVRLLFKPSTDQPLLVHEVVWYGRRCGGDLPLFAPPPPATGGSPEPDTPAPPDVTNFRPTPTD